MYRVVRIVVDVTLFVLLGGDVWGQMFLEGEASPAMVKLWRQARKGDVFGFDRTLFDHYLAFCRCLSVIRSFVICGAVIGLIAWWAVPQLLGLVFWVSVGLIIIALFVSMFKHFDLFRSFHPGIERDFRRLWQSVAAELDLGLQSIATLDEVELNDRAIGRLGDIVKTCRSEPRAFRRYERVRILFISAGLIGVTEANVIWSAGMGKTSTLRAAC